MRVCWLSLETAGESHHFNLCQDRCNLSGIKNRNSIIMVSYLHFLHVNQNGDGNLAQNFLCLVYKRKSKQARSGQTNRFQALVMYLFGCF